MSFEDTREIGLIVKANTTTYGGDRYAYDIQQQLRLANALVLTPA